jgi:hypothetical protein
MQVDVANLGWIGDGIVPENINPQEFINGSLKCAKDRYTFQKTLDLWSAMNDLVAQQGKSLPTGKLILPYIVALWN